MLRAPRGPCSGVVEHQGPEFDALPRQDISGGGRVLKGGVGGKARRTILPFSLLVSVVQWQRQIQIGASLLVIGFGIFRFFNRRHPRVLARIRPTQLGLWSFAVAIAHGAGLMLVPIYLGLCRVADLNRDHEAAGVLINANLGMAILVSVVHSVTMIAAGGFLAWLVYRYLGLTFVSRSWFNLDATWAFSLILVGALSLTISLASRH
jgi:hypothetical protein